MAGPGVAHRGGQSWFFRYDATAIAHFRLPALTTEAMDAPQGVRIMWNTFMLLPGALLTPQRC